MNNTTHYLPCETPQTFHTFHRFFECYRFFFGRNLLISILELILITTIAGANFMVLVLIVRKNIVMSIFDKMLFWLVLTYLVTSLIDFPFFHIEDLFTYWPFGGLASLIWTAYDNNVNTFVSFVMFYMTYARYKSVKMPLEFSRKLAFRSPHLVIVTFLIFGAAVWVLTVYFFETFEFTTHIWYKPDLWQLLINGLVWFLPLLGVYILSFKIFIQLKDIEKRKQSISVQQSRKPRRFAILTLIDAKSKFMIIIVAFLLQWTVPCIFMLVETFLPERIDSLIMAFKWTTYTVSLTDPILIWAFCI